MEFQSATYKEKMFVGQQKSLLELQAEIYSILQTSNFLQSRYIRGNLSPEFYFRRMKSLQEELLQVQMLISKKGKSLVDLTQNMQLPQDTLIMIREISSASDAQYDKFCQTWSIDSFQLAYIVASITSKFITLLDYIQLTDVLDPHFLNELIQEVSLTLSKMHTFQHFGLQLSQIFQSWQFDHQHSKSNSNSSESYQTQSDLKKVLGDRIYSLFNGFKGYLQK